MDTRTRILQEAARLFTEKGYEATSVQDLAEALGLSKAALYHHFRSKEEILLEISLLALKGLVRAGEEALKVEDPKEALLAFMTAHARYFEENRPSFVAMLQGLESLSPRAGPRPWPCGTGTRGTSGPSSGGGGRGGLPPGGRGPGGAGGALPPQLDDPLVQTRWPQAGGGGGAGVL
jgi:DNA-binding transcriptional ArsR family regulator